VRERGDARFETPTEEIEYLRAQIAEKERKLAELGHTVSREAVVHDELMRHKETPAHELLHDAHQLSRSEVGAIVLDLPPDDDDQVMGELLGVLQEKGVKNALTVAERLQNPHLEDDFHRFLVQYIAHGYPAPDLAEGAPLREDLAMTLFEVTLPDPTKDERERPLKEVVSAMEQFYLGMCAHAQGHGGRERHFALELAVSGEHEDIVFYLAVPKGTEDLFEKQLLSVFPKARAHYQPADYNIFVREGASAVAYATLEEDPALPIRDYREFDHDPLLVLINAFTKIAPVGEGAALQFVVGAPNDAYLKRYRKVLEKVHKGKKLKDALKDTPDTFAGEAFKLFREIVTTTASEGRRKEKEQENAAHVDDKLVEALQKKLETAILEVNVRLVTSAATVGRAEAIAHDIISSFNQFQYTHGNSIRFSLQGATKTQGLTRQFIFRELDRRQLLPLSVRELTTLMHFPTHAMAATPQLKRVQAALAPAPIDLPTTGTLLGVNSYRGVDTNAYLTDEDRLRHLYIIGQTGAGKTTFMKNLIAQDIERGAGLCFIDPHGSDIEDVLALIPEHRMNDVIYFDPADTQHVLGLNMLEYDPRLPEQKTFVVNELLSIFKKLYGKGNPESMGPAFEQYFRNATMLVMEDPATGNTMLDISRVMADARYREVKLARSKNPVVNLFWREIATKAQGESSLANIVPYITNKFDVFTANEIIRPIIAQQTSAIRMREIMDSRKILLVNLSKGRLGEINANLLGMILVGKILMAALSRVDALGSDLPHFYLYIDEFHNITTDSISAILSEARKYKLSLTIAHQYIAQIEEGIRDSVFGNVGNMAIFRVGSEDAEFLEPQLAPVFETQDIMNIENQHAYLRILARGTPQKPFSIRVPAPKRGSPDRSAYIKRFSAERYARPLEEVDREVRMRYGL